MSTVNTIDPQNHNTTRFTFPFAHKTPDKKKTTRLSCVEKFHCLRERCGARVLTIRTCGKLRSLLIVCSQPVTYGLHKRSLSQSFFVLFFFFFVGVRVWGFSLRSHWAPSRSTWSPHCWRPGRAAGSRTAICSVARWRAYRSSDCCCCCRCCSLRSRKSFELGWRASVRVCVLLCYDRRR